MTTTNISYLIDDFNADNEGEGRNAVIEIEGDPDNFEIRSNSAGQITDSLTLDWGAETNELIVLHALDMADRLTGEEVAAISIGGDIKELYNDEMVIQACLIAKTLIIASNRLLTGRSLNAENEAEAEAEANKWYCNSYECPCGNEWDDEWDCMCDDRCPSCNTTCSPSESIEIEHPG